MSLEDVRKKIAQQAGKEAEHILAQARQEADAILKEERQQEKERRKQAMDSLKAQLGQQQARQCASAELDAQKLVLNAKKDILDEVYAKARERIASTGAKERAAHIKALQKKASAQLDVATIYRSAQDASLVKGKDAPILGGIIAEDKDGKVRVDLSYDAALESVQSHTLREVASRLFGK